jgi:hypothetical protein
LRHFNGASILEELDVPVDEYKEPNYPVVKFLIKHGVWLSIAFGAVLFAVGFVFAWYGWGPIAAVVGAIVSIVATVLLVSYVEVLKMIADMLLPK